jgi:cellobiose phosphorylase
VREGFKALKTLYEAASDFEKSRMYPGIPEYFNIEGRGVYTYLTGAASWYLLTMITQVFGVRGEAGELIIEPKLMPEQFSENGEARIRLFFRGRKLNICICNRDGSEYGRYGILSACCNGDMIEMTAGKDNADEAVRLELSRLKEEEENEIKIIIGKKPL